MTLWRNTSPVVQMVNLIPGKEPLTVYPGHCIDCDKCPNPKFFKLNDVYIASKKKNIPRRVVNPQVRPEAQNRLVSIVVPTKNCAKYLETMINSVFKQTYKTIEIIIVDDGSEDKTRSVIQPLTGKINKFLTYYPSRGSNYARNIGYRLSRGEFVLFCDSDLTLYPNMILQMVAALDYDKGASFSYCKYNRIDEATKKTEIVGGGDWDANRLKQMNYISTMSLIRRSDLMLIGDKPFDERIKKFQDYDLWLSFLDKGKRGIFVNAILFDAWMRNDGITKTENEKEALNFIRKKHGIVR